VRETALAAAHAQLRPRWIHVNGMRLPGSFESEGDVRELAIADVSCFAKAGLKGPRAASWLAERGIPVPPRANTWTGDLIARLGETEFFLEGDAAGKVVETASQGVYPVLRQDTAIALAGRRVNEVLLETCSFNFAALDTQETLVMTSMAGVPVLVIPQRREGLPLTRIWADPTFAPYLWQTLLEIVQELGGGPAGLASVFPQLQEKGGSQ
jgi:sarcosine oxidase subunit gamma